MTTSLRSKKSHYVQARFYKIAKQLFKNIIFDNRRINGRWNSVIVVPALAQFKAAVAEELLILIGPRQFVSLIHRIQRLGLWREKIETNRKSVYKYEYELKTLIKIKESGLGWEGYSDSMGVREFSDSRIDELKVLMSPNLAAKSDEELSILATNWIEETRADRSLPEPLSDDQLEDYELTFKTRQRRFSK